MKTSKERRKCHFPVSADNEYSAISTLHVGYFANNEYSTDQAVIAVTVI
jgi:hypothetical protein